MCVVCNLKYSQIAILAEEVTILRDNQKMLFQMDGCPAYNSAVREILKTVFITK